MTQGTGDSDKIWPPEEPVSCNYDYLLKGILIFREHFSVLQENIHMTPRFSVVSTYIKLFPAAPGQGRYKHCFNADEVPF